MAALDCLVDHVPYDLVISLKNTTSHRGTNVITTNISTVTV